MSGNEQRLKWVLRHRKLIILGTFGLAVVSLGLLKFHRNRVLSRSGRGAIHHHRQDAIGARVEETNKAVVQLESIIKNNVPELQTMVSDIGVPSAKSGKTRSVETQEVTRRTSRWPSSAR